MWSMPTVPVPPMAILEVPEDMAPALQAALYQQQLGAQHYMIQSIEAGSAFPSVADMDSYSSFPMLEPMVDALLDCSNEPQQPTKPERPAPSVASTVKEDPQETNIYISNLPRSITDAKFRSLCATFGQVFSTKLLHREAPMPTIGFAQFTEPEMAASALQKLNGTMYQGRQLKVRMAHRDKDKGISNKASANLYVSNLPKHYTETNLRGAFSVYGNIISLVILRHPLTGKSKGIGLVRFSSVGEARRAKESLHGMTLMPNSPLEVKYAENDKDRSRRIAKRQHPENEHVIPEALDMCQTIESYKKHLQTNQDIVRPPIEVAAVPIEEPAPAAAEDSDTPDPDAIYSALAQYAKLLIPLEGPRSIEKLTMQSEPTTPPRSSVLGTSQSSQSLDTVSESCGHSSGGDSVSTPPSAAPSAEVAKETKTVKLRPNAPPFVPKGLPQAAAAQTPAPAPKAPGAAIASDESTTIKVEGLPWGANQVMLYKLCSPHGAIAQVNLGHDKATQASTAFVQFKNPMDALKAQGKLNGTPLNQKPLRVSL